LYPPVGEALGSNSLCNGRVVQTPLNGYQSIPLQSISTGANSENSAWLEGATNCANAQISSDNFFFSELVLNLLSETQDFYNGLTLMINRTFTASQTSFKNAYTIFDLLNVASIHNGTDNFPAAYLLTSNILFQPRTLADAHGFNLVLQQVRAHSRRDWLDHRCPSCQSLNGTITSKGES
jgi:hypothetical protein